MSRRPPIPPAVYAIADAGMIGSERLPAAVAALASSGIRWIQLRAKRVPDCDLLELARACQRSVDLHGTELWIDDRADVARILSRQGCRIAGVHVGQGDLPPVAVRRVVGDGLWIGSSTHDEAQLRAADSDPEVDVVALGPIYPTTSKEDAEPVVGLEGLRRARTWTAKPLVAIGGITPGRVAEVLRAGADSVAVLGAACAGRGVDDWRENGQRLLAAAGGAAA